MTTCSRRASAARSPASLASVWLAISLSVVGLGLVLLVLAGLSSWRRFGKMKRAGGRVSRRMGALGEAAALLSERVAKPEHLGADD
jgi:hypothetical protein